MNGLNNLKGNNMEKEFVTYEQAKALKKLGFVDPCWCYFMNSIFNDSMFIKDYDYLNKMTHSRCILAPLKQQVFRWFRDKYQLGAQPLRDGGWWVVNVVDYSDEENDSPQDHLTLVKPADGYEEAESSCIDKLIEIIKEK